MSKIPWEGGGEEDRKKEGREMRRMERRRMGGKVEEKGEEEWREIRKNEIKYHIQPVHYTLAILGPYLHTTPTSHIHHTHFT